MEENAVEAQVEEGKKVEEAAAEVDGSDVLVLCAGGCKKKILNFGNAQADGSWGDGVVGSLCIDCVVKGFKPAETPKPKEKRRRKK